MPCGCRPAKLLDGDVPVQQFVVGPPHPRGRPAADQFRQPVAAGQQRTGIRMDDPEGRSRPRRGARTRTLTIRDHDILHTSGGGLGRSSGGRGSRVLDELGEYIANDRVSGAGCLPGQPPVAPHAIGSPRPPASRHCHGHATIQKRGLRRVQGPRCLAASVPVADRAKQLIDRLGRERRFPHEPDDRARLDQVEELVLGVGGKDNQMSRVGARVRRRAAAPGRNRCLRRDRCRAASRQGGARSRVGPPRQASRRCRRPGCPPAPAGREQRGGTPGCRRRSSSARPQPQDRSVAALDHCG